MVALGVVLVVECPGRYALLLFKSHNNVLYYLSVSSSLYIICSSRVDIGGQLNGRGASEGGGNIYFGMDSVLAYFMSSKAVFIFLCTVLVAENR